MDSPLFFAKILLFGEYGIIKNSKGISIPFDLFSGALKIGDLNNNEINQSNLEITKFNHYLKQNFQENEINFDLMDKDLQNGLYFKSSIPTGYGVGSSGSLVAAIYEKYFINVINNEININSNQIFHLKQIFSKMESFFHGTSSGFDPLNSYLSSPILINSKKDVKTTLTPNQNNNGKIGFFLIDSEESSDTSILVKQFQKNMEDSDFKNIFQNEFISFTNSCVQDFLDSNFNSLSINFKKLSRFTFDNFKMMIPNKFDLIWKNGLKSNKYYLKLCGSGGGGYILGFSLNIDEVKEQLSAFNFQEILRY